MPSVSKAQQRFMGLVHAYKKGEVPASQVSQAVKDAAKSMKKKSTKDFASTKHDDLPDKVREYLVSENPAAAAAAAMVMMKLQNPDTGKKISAITPLRNKDHKLHKKSKGIFQRLKDKFMKKNESINEDGHTDVASAERKLKLIMKDAMDTLNALGSVILSVHQLGSESSLDFDFNALITSFASCTISLSFLSIEATSVCPSSFIDSFFFINLSFNLWNIPLDFLCSLWSLSRSGVIADTFLPVSGFCNCIIAIAAAALAAGFSLIKYSLTLFGKSLCFVDAKSLADFFFIDLAASFTALLT